MCIRDRSYTLGYVPKEWRKVKVVFIPKAGKRDTDLPKSFRPISLATFLLKTMEKIIDSYLRNGVLKRQPLNEYQFAYQSGKSTDTALHHLVQKVENTLKNKEIALVAFLDIEGAFDNTSYFFIERAARAVSYTHLDVYKRQAEGSALELT